YDAIAGKGLRGLALDCRGHGESAKPHDASKYDREDMARDVFNLMDHAGIERAHLLGFSMGAHVALTAAMADGGRIDHLVVAGVGGRIFEPPRDPDGMAKAMEAATPDEIADPMLKSFRHFADEQKEDRLALAACSRGPCSTTSGRASRKPSSSSMPSGCCFSPPSSGRSSPPTSASCAIRRRSGRCARTPGS